MLNLRLECVKKGIKMKLSFIKYYIVDALKPFFPKVELGIPDIKDFKEIASFDNQKEECKCLNACVNCTCGKQR